MPNFARILYYLGSGLQRLSWSQEKLKKYQNMHIKAVVRYAYDFVPFYRKWFNIHNISPCDIANVEDLSKLPVLSKDAFRRVPISEMVSKEYDISCLKVLQTSGSTGKPFRFFVSKPEDDWRKAIYLRANISCGQRPLDKWAFVTSPHHFGDTTSIQRRLGLFAQNLISVFDKVSEQVRYIDEIGVDILDGYSGALFLIAREAKRQGVRIRPKLLFGSSDSIGYTERKFMEKIFSAPYLDQYGCSETNRLAWQCPLREGYHMDVDSVVMQFVDEDGNDVNAGTDGEVVLTSLYNFAMPFIRYSLGDIGQQSNYCCSCGRVLPLMKNIQGRRDSFITLPDGRLVSPRTLTVAMGKLSFFGEIEQFQIMQRKKDLFDISLHFRKKFENTELVVNELRMCLSRALLAQESDITFNIQFVNTIHLSDTGRLKTVFSEVS